MTTDLIKFDTSHLETVSDAVRSILLGQPLISEPGLYPDFDERAYLADPVIEPSATRTTIKALIERTPRSAWINHPRLNPKYDDTDDDKFNLGSTAHTAVLSRGKKVVYGDYADYRTNDAKAFRANAKAAGLLPVLEGNKQRVVDMVSALHEQLPEHGLGHLFKPDGGERPGKSEVVMVWRDGTGGWCRAMIDWLEMDLTITDYKTTELELSPDPDDIGRHCNSMGSEWQDAFYRRGLINLFPEIEGRVKFRFIFQEVREPFTILPVELPNDAKAMGEANVQRGLERWAECKASGNWPRFLPAQTAAYPPWATAEFPG